MGLCGSFRCGCGLTSSPAVSGAINGELPSIVVSGSGEAGDLFNLSLNDQWASEVAKLGWVADATASDSDQTGISTLADVTGVTVTFTADPTRKYLTTLNINVSKQTSASLCDVVIADGLSTTVRSRTVSMAIDELQAVVVEVIESGLSGSTTRKARAKATTNTMSVINGFERNATISVFDIGPA